MHPHRFVDIDLNPCCFCGEYRVFHGGVVVGQDVSHVCPQCLQFGHIVVIHGAWETTGADSSEMRALCN